MKTKKISTMALAHINAQHGVDNFGGTKSQYFAEALKLAHKGINLASKFSDFNKTFDFVTNVYYAFIVVMTLVITGLVSLILPLLFTVMIIAPIAAIVSALIGMEITDKLFDKLYRK